MKKAKKRKQSKKSLILTLALTLILGCAVGGTLAWLQDTTSPVTNTFTAGEVDITLKESPYHADTNTYGTPDENVQNQYPAIPGATYKKDPVVAVREGSEDCYLFVKFERSKDANTYLTYTSTLVEDGSWKKISTTEDDNVITEVWCRVVKKADTTRSWEMLADLGEKNYGEDITLEINPNAVTNSTMAKASAQSLKWTAYAVQFNYLKDSKGAIAGDAVEAAARAWAIVSAN